MAEKHPDAPFVYDWPMANVAVDIVLISEDNERNGGYNPKVLMIRRGKDPYKGKLALPGGFLDVDKDKSLEDAAWRELEEETKLDRETIQKHTIDGPIQTGAWGDIGRDPRGRVVSISYAIFLHGELPALASDDAEEGSEEWVPLYNLPSKEEFAFEHRDIIVKSCVAILGIARL